MNFMASIATVATRPLCALARADAGGDIHLRQDTAAKYAAARIGAGRHCQRAHRQLAAWLLFLAYHCLQIRKTGSG